MASMSLQQLRVVEDMLRQIRESLPDLREAVDYFIEHLYEIVPFDK